MPPLPGFEIDRVEQVLQPGLKGFVRVMQDPSSEHVEPDPKPCFLAPLVSFLGMPCRPIVRLAQRHAQVMARATMTSRVASLAGLAIWVSSKLQPRVLASAKRHSTPISVGRGGAQDLVEVGKSVSQAAKHLGIGRSTACKVISEASQRQMFAESSPLE